ncbi:hypothetical protein KIPB_015299, partial [Kipferlia bialata]|eukprot:g15299.t1
MCKTVFVSVLVALVGAVLWAWNVEAPHHTNIPPTVPRTQYHPVLGEDICNMRYCEVMAVQRRGFNIALDVYNTMALNLCPEEAWDAITT